MVVKVYVTLFIYEFNWLIAIAFFPSKLKYIVFILVEMFLVFNAPHSVLSNQTFLIIGLFSIIYNNGNFQKNIL